jgi:L-lactate dehydrogenase complex protein LldE
MTTVTLFVQCIVDALYPEVGQAMLRILHQLGMDVKCPADQTCCGQPAFNSGYRRSARVAAKHFIEVFEESQIIVCPSGSCVNMVRHHYPQLLQSEASYCERARAIASRTFEFTEFIVDVLKIENLAARYSGKITYHDSCHLLRGIGVREQPRKLLRNVEGAEFIEMKDSDRCCGFGGAFAVKYADISTAMVADKAKNIIASGADTLVGCDMGCLMNIQGFLSRIGADIKVRHIAQILAGAS